MKKQYKIAEHIVELTANDNSPVWKAGPNYLPFETEALDIEPLCSLEVVDTLEPGESEAIYEANDNGFPRISFSRSKDGWIVELAPDNRAATVAVMQASEDFSKAQIKLFDESLRTVRFALDNALMLMYAISGATKGTLEIHSSVVTYKGKAYSFLGKSGTGKSTHSRLWMENIEGCELLNDDNPIIRVSNSQARIYGSPWSGKTKCYKNKDAEIGAIVNLAQSKENKIWQLSPVASYAALFSSCSAFREVKGVADGIHDSFEKLISLVAVYHLECRPDREAALICNSKVAL